MGLWICQCSRWENSIGKDDFSNVIDLEDYKRLMDDIPTKIKNYMGITSEVNLLQENGKSFIEII
ncbi:hypothetical protein EZS27_028818 [termite gut metagenome]|jgi:ATP-dependent DNA helicase RecG|uniref:Uncharacterized protein n=1 Tax=termite gut metagenome TaxID=433724 RepID=A0A5J4QKR5_9ZZZZ